MPKTTRAISTSPSLLKLNAEQGGAAEWIRSTFQYAADEVAAGRPGSETVLAKLSELLFVEAVRRYAESLPPGETGWLAGLRDPHVARALALLHRDIARPWSVDDLSREVGLSRSALADRFIGLIGMPPMHYVANWRMQVATQKLRSTSASLAQVADLVGYSSEAAFSRAFKKAFGTAPATWLVDQTNRPRRIRLFELLSEASPVWFRCWGISNSSSGVRPLCAKSGRPRGGAALVQLAMPSRAQSKNANAASQDCSTLSVRSSRVVKKRGVYAKSYLRGRQSASYPWPLRWSFLSSPAAHRPEADDISSDCAVLRDAQGRQGRSGSGLTGSSRDLSADEATRVSDLLNTKLWLLAGRNRWWDPWSSTQ